METGDTPSNLLSPNRARASARSEGSKTEYVHKQVLACGKTARSYGSLMVTMMVWIPARSTAFASAPCAGWLNAFSVPSTIRS